MSQVAKVAFYPLLDIPIMMMQKSVKWLLIFLKLSQEYQKSNNKTFLKNLIKRTSTFHLENLEFRL